MKDRVVRAVFAAAMIAACGSVWADIPVSAYVQNGLVVQFDGIDNAGTGTHDPTATVWKDLVAANGGAYDMTLTANGKYIDTALVSDGKKTAAKGTSPAVTIAQIEGCFTLDSDKTVNSALYSSGLVTGSNMDWCIGLLSTHRGYLFGGNTPMFAVGNDYSGFHTISSTKSDCFYDGSSDSVTKGANNYFGSTTARQPGTAAVGGFGDGDTPCAVKMHSIRIYNRALTAEDIAMNAEVDLARFSLNSGNYRWNDETEKLERHVCVSVNDETRGSVVAKVDGFAVSSSSFWYAAGSSVELTPTPASGYKFVRWLGDMSGVEVDSDGVATFSGLAHKLTAIFALRSADPKDRAWSGAGDGRDWFDEDNWLPVGVPAEGDFVTIGSGKSIVLTNSTEAVSSLSLASTLACSNWTTCIRAVDVKLLSGAVIKPVCAFSDAEMSNRVWVACHNIEVQTGGSINANNLGYKTGSGPCWKGSPVSSQASSYGGMAGSGVTYGSVTEPEDPGSGAGSGGTAGGGAIRIDATGALVLNGTITATGAGGGYWGPGDSGGGVYISCASIVGVGSVSANAANYTGDCAAYYNGGGGRIAVHYNPSVQDEVGACEVRFNANGGVRKGNTTAGARCNQVSGAGSLYFTDDRFLHRPKVDLCGVVWIDDNGTAVQPTEYAFAAGQDFTNSKLEFPCDDTVVTYDGDLTFAGTLTRAYGFRFTGFRPKLTVTGTSVCKARQSRRQGASTSSLAAT